MPPHQSKITIANAGPAPMTSRRPPMTSKQAKKAYAKATSGPKMSWAERRRIEAAELAAQRKEFERERALARARAARERKEAKEEVERMKRKKAGVPEKSRWVRASQGRITGFLGLGKRGRSEDLDVDEEVDEEEEEDGESDGSVGGWEEPVSKKLTLHAAEDATDERDSIVSRPPDEPLMRKQLDDIAEDPDDTESEELEYPVGIHDAKEPERSSKLQPETEDQPEPQVQAKPQLQPEPELDEPKLPTNNQFLISSQDFLDDDDIFQELATAHQLIPESLDAEKNLLAFGHHFPDLEANDNLERSPAALSPTTALHLFQRNSRPTMDAKSIEPRRRSLSPNQQPVSPILQRTPQSKMEFACSGISPELSSSNPFSENQAALRSINRAIRRPSSIATPSVMGPPDVIIRHHTTLSTPMVTENRGKLVPNTTNSLSQKKSRDLGLNVSNDRRALKDISGQAQNAQRKDPTASTAYTRPFLKPSQVAKSAVSQISSFAPPTSTQLFLADHLDDFFPSPSQEMRELLEDIDDDEIPSNTQVACELGVVNTKSKPVVTEPSNLVLDDDFPWMSSRDFILSSQESQEVETPTAKASPPQPTPWDLRKARKPRFFVEKEEDLLAAAVDESKAQAKKDQEAAKIRLESIRLERELLGSGHSSRYPTERVTQSSHNAPRLKGTADQVSVSDQAELLEANESRHMINELKSDDYGYDFDDMEAEASMIAFVDELENEPAPLEPGF